MKKSKLSLFLMSMLAVTSLVACNTQENSSSAGSDNSSSQVPASSSSSDNSSSSQSQGGDVVELTSIALNKTQTTIMLGSDETLTVTFTPNNATDKELVWSSDDATIASVTNGKVTANKVGSTTIRVASKNKSSVNASCQVTVTDNVVLTNVSLKDEFVAFESHKKKDSAQDDGFYDHNQTYKVGDDNEFNVKPKLTVTDRKTLKPVSADKWNYDFEISATYNDQPADATYFSVTDARECDVKFTEAAIGKTFTISVIPGGIADSKKVDFTRSITVDVIDGYNVYDAKEISYFDTREQNSELDMPRVNDVQLKCQWYDFKVANGLDPTLHPTALIFQKDIKLTAADLPANCIYTAAQATELDDEKAAGSLLDRLYIYEHTTENGMTIEGNYFDFDMTEIPLIKREDNKKTEEGAVVAHSALFKAITGTDIIFRNINMSGNARNATGNADKVLSGGFIFCKGAGSQTFQAYNIIATKFYITFFGEKPYYDGEPTQFNLNKIKCYNNFNSFLYNWGAQVIARDSLFRSCGGPIIIQDHTGTDEYESHTDAGYDGIVVYGYAPSTRFIDCSLINYVAGSEAWFQQFGVTALVGQIKDMSDLLGATGLPKSFVVDSERKGRFNAALSAAGQAAFFNFIAINKSGSDEGATASPACGLVEITNSGKGVVYDYRQPANDELVQAAAAYEANPTAETGAAVQAAATAKGITFTSQEELITKVTDYVKGQNGKCTVHGTFRYINNTLGAPVIDLGPAYDLLAYDGKPDQHPYLQSLMGMAGGDFSMYAATADQKAATPDAMALYYQGMMLVFGLTPYAA